MVGKALEGSLRLYRSTYSCTRTTSCCYTRLRVLLCVDPDGVRRPQGSLVYHNNPLRDCTLSTIPMRFEALDRSAGQVATQQHGVSVEAYIGCLVDTPQGTVQANFSTSYESIRDHGLHKLGATAFARRNTIAQTGLYRAAVLLQS